MDQPSRAGRQDRLRAAAAVALPALTRPALTRPTLSRLAGPARRLPPAAALAGDVLLVLVLLPLAPFRLDHQGALVDIDGDVALVEVRQVRLDDELLVILDVDVGGGQLAAQAAHQSLIEEIATEDVEPGERVDAYEIACHDHSSAVA